MRRRTLSFLAASCLVMLNGSTSSKEYSEAQQQMLHRRAVEAVIWGQPAEGVFGFIQATRRDLGGDWNDVVYFSQPMTSRHGFLTANNNTPYVVSCINTNNGPIVVDVPAASEKVKYFGSLIDAWQLPIADVGPSGDDKGQGAKYLLLPPDYEGEIPEEYLVYRPATYSIYLGFRPVSVVGADTTPEEVIEYAQKLQVYSLSEADSPPSTRFIDAFPQEWDTLPRYDISFFHDLATIVNNEPVQARDLAMMGLLESLGIKKGEEFHPNPELTEILETAAQDAYDYLQWQFVTPGKALTPYWEDSQWSVFNIDPEQAAGGFPFVTEDRLMVDERGELYFYVTFMPKKLGGGSFYLTALRDRDGNLFDGQSSYQMRVPADTPAGDFWSVIVYSMQTKGFVEDVERVGLSSLDAETLQHNEDGSVDLYFGPQPPSGMESNWVPTGEDFFLMFRFYDPQQPLFDKSWQLPEVEKLN